MASRTARLKTCLVCGGEFAPGLKRKTLCSDECAARRRREQNRVAQQRRASEGYHRKRYWANPEKVKAKNKMFYYRHHDRNLERRRQWHAANALAVKVKRQWGVSLQQARAMIEQGSFPP